MSNTKIEWATNVWNPVTGCTKVSMGCRNCYAERMAKRLRGRCGYDGDNPFQVTLHPERLVQPLRWQKPQRVFVNSMSDLFHSDVPDEFIARVFEQMWRCHNHTFMVLTKRPERMAKWPVMRREEVIPNLWLGISVEDQSTADERIPILLQTPAAVRFVSCEPLLGPVNLAKKWRKPASDGSDRAAYPCSESYLFDLDWVIAGGESGPGARPMHPDWARSLRDQCQGAGVPFFFKQWGEWAPSKMLHEAGIAPGESRHPWGLCQPTMTRVGKKAAGNTLDGKTWEQFPDGVE